MNRLSSSQKEVQKPRLLDRVRQALRTRHYSYRTEKSYVSWIRRFVLFHNKRRPDEMGEKEISEFLTHLAVKKRVSASTQNQALCALLFLYKEVLGREVGDLGDVTWAKRSKKIPEVLTQDEVRQVLAELTGVKWIMANLLYGSGLRLAECIRLRVKDIDFARREITPRDAKGKKDRVTMLPEKLIQPLQKQVEKVKKLHERDLKDGFGTVHLPYALERKYPNANKALHWQYIFPASQISVDPRSGRKHRHHVDDSVLQRAVKVAVRKAGIRRHVGCHTLPREII